MTLGLAFHRIAKHALAASSLRACAMVWLGVVALMAADRHPALAAELLMFSQRACPFCEAFSKEIEPDYALSKAGTVAPLRHVDIFEDRTGGIAGLEPAVFTPTFVLVDKGREIGRMMGYPGRKYFYPELQTLLDKLATQP